MTWWVRYAVTLARAKQGFRLLTLAGRPHVSGVTLLTIAVSLAASILLTINLAQLHQISAQFGLPEAKLRVPSWLSLIALAAYAQILFSQMRPKLYLYEHGLVFRSSFAPWYTISKCSWDRTNEEVSRLTLHGDWFSPVQIWMATDDRSVAEGLISGASRFQARSKGSALTTTILRVLGWILCFAILCWLACSLALSTTATAANLCSVHI